MGVGVTFENIKTTASNSCRISGPNACRRISRIISAMAGTRMPVLFRSYFAEGGFGGAMRDTTASCERHDRGVRLIDIA